jgi:hypothetical protein
MDCQGRGTPIRFIHYCETLYRRLLLRGSRVHRRLCRSWGLPVFFRLSPLSASTARSQRWWSSPAIPGDIRVGSLEPETYLSPLQRRGIATGRYVSISAGVSFVFFNYTLFRKLCGSLV